MKLLGEWSWCLPGRRRESAWVIISKGTCGQSLGCRGPAPGHGWSRPAQRRLRSRTMASRERGQGSSLRRYRDRLVALLDCVCVRASDRAKGSPKGSPLLVEAIRLRGPLYRTRWIDYQRKKRDPPVGLRPARGRSGEPLGWLIRMARRPPLPAKPPRRRHRTRHPANRCLRRPRSLPTGPTACARTGSDAP